MFNSLESLNVAIFESLSAFNGRRMNGRSLSRREQIEAEYLRPLPAIRHQMKEQRSTTVMRNCYVTFKLHHYSMPKEYIGKRVEIVYDADTLKIYIIRKTKCFDFWERNVLFPKTKRSFFRTPTPLPCPFPLNFSLLIITKKFGNLAKNRYICIV